MDLFDPKPLLTKHDGKPYPGGDLGSPLRQSRRGNCLGSPYKFQKFGQWRDGSSPSYLPHTGSIADDICLVRSMNTESVDHESALRLIHSGKFLAGMPALARRGPCTHWAMKTKILPAYVVLLRPPAAFPSIGERKLVQRPGCRPNIRGTTFRSGSSAGLQPAIAAGKPSRPLARISSGFLEGLNREHLARPSREHRQIKA